MQQTEGTLDPSKDVYVQRTEKSKALYEEAKKVLPAGVTYAIRHFEPYPFYVTKGSGTRIWDVDGNEYVDYWMGHGALIMGHAYPPVVEAAKAQIEIGSHLGYSTEWELKFAKQVVKMVPSAKMVRPTNSGTEANMYAIRLARTFTGRTKIAKFEGNWHGGADVLHKAVSFPFEQPASAGLDPEVQANTLVLPYNDLHGVEERIEGEQEKIACFLLEPMMGGGGLIPADIEFLKGMRELADRAGALLIFDEVITGFRLAPGGGQEYFGVLPDLTILGKIVGGGAFPAGCFCGREDVMERIDHLKFRAPSQRSFHGGTYSGNALTCRAGYTLLSDLDRKRDDVYPYLEKLGRRARDGLTSVFERYGFQAFVTGLGGSMCVHFTKALPTNVRTASESRNTELAEEYFRFMLANNISFLSPTTAHCLLSGVHTTQEIDQFLNVTEVFVRKHRRN